jgi:acylphosphatase
MSGGILHKNITISGRVQGVGFRYAARNTAFSLGITGFVKNLSNGNVYIEAEGSFSQMEDFLSWCNQGPVRAIIKKVDIYVGEPVGYTSFLIR